MYNMFTETITNLIMNISNEQVIAALGIALVVGFMAIALATQLYKSNKALKPE